MIHHFQKPVRDSDYDEYEYMDSVLEYMFKLGDILTRHSGIENLFIMRNLSQTTLDYQSFKKLVRIYLMILNLKDFKVIKLYI